jgi:hypothetical protein
LNLTEEQLALLRLQYYSELPPEQVRDGKARDNEYDEAEANIPGDYEEEVNGEKISFKDIPDKEHFEDPDFDEVWNSTTDEWEEV